MRNDHPIRIRGLRVHNLKNIDLDIPRNRLVVISGVSGSGKSSLAFDTLFAEGQRRYIETFSAYTRQFLERIDRPEADSIENIPPAIAIRQRTAARNSRSTVGSVTEINDFLRLLFAKIGHVFCQGCGKEIASDTPRSAINRLQTSAAGMECLITFPVEPVAATSLEAISQSLLADGFVRVVLNGQVIGLNESSLAGTGHNMLHVVVDRIRVGTTPDDRVIDSLETAFLKGNGRCDVLVPDSSAESLAARSYARALQFSRRWRCEPCNRDYPEPEPRLYSSNNPMGACPDCRGFGDCIDIDMSRVVPDASKSLRQGAIAPWNAPAYSHELTELLALAKDYGIEVDVPFAKLSARQLKLIREGVPDRDFGGLNGFFNWLERKKYKLHIRLFLSRWRSYRTCQTCQGRRLRQVALATRVGGRNIAEVLSLQVGESLQFFDALSLADHERIIGRAMLDRISSRLRYLHAVGLGYLTLDRPLRTLSGGEGQRVALTKALGSGLVNTLYVLDEPSIGLHERDTHRLIEVVRALRDVQNSVVLVEHDEAILRAADHLIDMGPAAGAAGGQVVYQGPLAGLTQATSVTADFLEGRRGISVPQKRRPTTHGWISVRGARGNNLKNIAVEFPLRTLCLVTGVSGSGKSTLVEQTLYAGLRQALGKATDWPAKHDDIAGAGQIGDVVLVDQDPIGRTSRSNPVTYVKAFQEIRRAFAESTEARIHNYGPGHFSFNVEGGRCSACQGQGVQIIDMQFLADISITCPDCEGSRYRKEVLNVKYRGKNIAEVLDMSISEAILFFRGRTKLCEALAPLVAVGLDYLKLGQPADTLSGGEAQRLKLAGQLAETSRQRTMIILDEPTTGLHTADIARLIDCFTALLDVGHSLVVVEHNMELIKCADWIIDLGPEAAEAGGHIVGCGTPEQLAQVQDSHTGRFLRQLLRRQVSGS
jgi:excinuclease ABC subunit A